MGKLRINILGTSFSVKAAEDDEYLQKLLSYYKEITSSIQGTSALKDPLQVSILAGITLVDELIKEKQKNISYSDSEDARNKQEAERITLDMIEKIDRALE